MTALLQRTLEELASTENQQKRLVAYLREHEAEILNYVNDEVDPSPPLKPLIQQRQKMTHGQPLILTVSLLIQVFPI